MSFTERLKVVIDVVSDGATRGISDFRSEVAKADTFAGKLKAGTKSLSGTFSSFVSSPAGAATAIAAVGTAAIKAADQFSNLAKQALDLGKATGLSTEEASRWLATADDFGVSAESLAAGIGRISKSLDSPKWAEYGIATRDAAGNARSSNEIFLDTLDLLGRTPSATERARIGADLLGKGWQSISPIVGNTREEYEKMLASVSEGQVITDGEAAKGEKWRLAMDNLGDSFGDVALSLGEVAVAFEPVLNAIADLLKYAPSLLDQLGISDDSSESVAAFKARLEETRGSAVQTAVAFGEMSSSVLENKNVLQQWKWIFGAAFNDTASEIEIMRASFKQLAEEQPDVARETVAALEATMQAAYRGDAAAQAYVEGWHLSIPVLSELKAMLPDVAAGVDDTAGAQDDAASATDDATDALRRNNEEIRKKIDLERELYGDQRDLIERQRDYTQTQVDLMSTMADSTSTVDDQMEAIIGLSEEYGTLNGASLDSREGTFRQIEKLKELRDSVAPGSPLYVALSGYIGQLEQIPATVDTQVRLGIIGSVFNSVGDMIGQRFGARALGGPVSKDEMYQVGEGGKPELLTDSAGRTFLIPGRDGVVTPIGGTMASGGVPAGNVTVNVTVTNPMMSGEQLANELKAYITRNGKGWLQ